MDGEQTVVLYLDGVCVGTAAKRAYDRLLSQLLELDAEDPNWADLEVQFELLKDFLEQTDIPRMRARDPELNGSVVLRVRLRRVGQAVAVEKLHDGED